MQCQRQLVFKLGNTREDTTEPKPWVQPQQGFTSGSEMNTELAGTDSKTPTRRPQHTAQAKTTPLTLGQRAPSGWQALGPSEMDTTSHHTKYTE